MAPHVDLVLGEVRLIDLQENASLRASFLDVQAPWIAAGVRRWLGLVRTDGAWPVFVLAAWQSDAPTRLLGTVVGVWAPQPIGRFDDLLETECPDGLRGAARPQDGVWHFVAATVSPQAEGLNLGRRLVGAALDWMTLHAPNARARTLSPAVGLPGVAALLHGTDPIRDAVLHVANAQGQPALDILRLHLGAGATLEAILRESRRDEARSGHVTLRFAYDVDTASREAQKLRYKAWLERRARQIAAGSVTALQDGALWQVENAQDAEVTAA